MSNIPISASQFGTPVFSNMILDSLVVNEVILNISNRKNLVMTDIAGRNGTVKEYINRGDYQISARGLLVADFGNFYPERQVKNFRRICELESEVIIASAFLNHFNITTVVITHSWIGENEGIRNAVPFSLEMVSETPIQIKLNA
jgi:hypothetical protein